MSMLSEPRRRQKWSLNPRGNLWSKDDSKFGKKLLEKMGWEEGKGLGATNQGMIDPIMLRSKDDQKGVGYTGHDDVWLDHQNDFDAILKTLNVENSNDDIVKESKMTALEEVSKNGKKRVHYRKFTRGKDLSQYSAVDLGCILGTQRKGIRKAYKEEVVDSSAVNTETESSTVQSSGPSSETEEKEVKKMKKKKKREMKESEDESSDVAKISFAQNDDSLLESPTTEKKEEALDEDGKRKSSFLTLNRGSMNAYFEQKMAAKKLNLTSASEQPVKTEENGKGKNEKLEEKKKKKKRKQDETIASTEEQVTDITIKVEKEDNVVIEPTEEKKSKKKRNRDEMAVSTEEQVSDINIKKESTVDQTGEKKSKKKRKRETEEQGIEIEKEFFIDTKGTPSNDSEVSRPKKKSKNSKSKKVSVDDEPSNTTTENKVKKEPDSEEKVIENIDEESAVKEKKKKKRKEIEAIEADEPEPIIKTKLAEKEKVPEKKKKEKEKATNQELKKGKKKKSSSSLILTPTDVDQLIGFKGASSSVLQIKGYGNHGSL